MLELVLILIVVIILVGLCLHHNSMKIKLNETAQLDSSLVRKAAEHSIMASNTVNPIFAMVEVTKAVQILECLHDRYGVNIASELTKVDTKAMLEVIQNQKERITQDVMVTNPNLIPQHPLNNHARIIPPAT